MRRFVQKNLMKCCKEILLPDGKQIPFCAYNSVGYREQARQQLEARERGRNQARRTGVPYTPGPLTFAFDRPFPQHAPANGSGTQHAPVQVLQRAAGKANGHAS